MMIKEKNELFHIRVIVKHTKVDILFDSSSQVNLILKSIVKKFVLKNENPVKYYPLSWVQKYTKLQVTK